MRGMLHRIRRKTNRADRRKRRGRAGKSEEGKEAEEAGVVGDETRNRKTEETGKTLSKKASRTCSMRTYGGQRVEIYRVVVALRSSYLARRSYGAVNSFLGLRRVWSVIVIL